MFIELGYVKGVIGLKGHVRMCFHTDDVAALKRYKDFYTHEGRPLARVVSFKPLPPQEAQVLFEGVQDRTQAESWKGVKVYVSQEALPALAEGVFYHQQLVGLRCFVAGAQVGVVKAVDNFGAQDILEIQPLEGASVYFPFTSDACPQVDLAQGTLQLDPSMWQSLFL